MNGVIEALHIYDEHNALILSHTYTSRPLSAQHLLPLYLEHPVPRPNLIYLAHTNPPTLVFSLRHVNLLFLLTASSEVEPLLVLEFLHRAVDALEEFLGAPLLAHKLEANYDVVAQLLTEMCDAGTVSTTEPNALRDLVEVEGFMDKLLGGLNLPTKPNFPAPFLPSLPTPALPWRRANVRHTSNELYADAGTAAAPVLQDLVVTVPLPEGVRSLSEVRPTKGDANYNPGDRALEWTISNKELAQGTSSFALRCTVVGQMADEDEEEGDPTGFGFGGGYVYDEPYQSSSPKAKPARAAVDAGGGGERDERRAAQNKILMPSSASVSFAVKGWLASGIKVESIHLDPRKSRGVGESVKPYKGVKYLTVSKGGVEIRC
ncbi:hypothetical protein N0V88_002704 [Collariella sp. IMI 366227]|nr:hypothetical protein N0V88_002704 [Collariella sp. IMI 366227]